MICTACKYHVYVEGAFQALLTGICMNAKSEHCDSAWDDGCPEWVGINSSEEIGGQNGNER